MITLTDEISKIYTSKGNGALFVQLDGPGTKPLFLQCYDVDDFEIDKGAVNTLLQCFDPSGKWKTLGFTRNTPSLIDLSLGTYMGKTADALETATCPFAVYLLLRCGGKTDLITNYDRMWVIRVASVGTHSIQGIIRKEEDVSAMQAFGAQAYPGVIAWFKLEGMRQAITEVGTGDPPVLFLEDRYLTDRAAGAIDGTDAEPGPGTRTVTDTENKLTIGSLQALNDIAFCNEERCQGRCGTIQNICTEGFAAGSSGAAYDIAALVETDDGGTNWDAGAADPFDTGEDISAIQCIASPIGSEAIRTIVARGTTDAGNPAEIAWTEDGGASWTNVDVGSVNGQYVVNDNGLFALDYYNIWLVTDDGYIYYSANGGADWTAQESGTITSNAYHSIHFSDKLIGYAGSTSGVIVKTVNGGSYWEATTTAGSGTVTGLWVFDSQNVIVVESNSSMYKTTDGGTTWSQISTFPLSTGSLDDIEFVNDYTGAVLHNTAAPVGSVYVTFDGGFTWELVSGVSNDGLNSIYFCATDLLYAVGNHSDTGAVIIKYRPEE